MVRRASIIPGDDQAARKLTPQQRADAVAYQYRRRQELVAADTRGEIQGHVWGDAPPAWAQEIARQYAARMGKPIEAGREGEERLRRMAWRLSEAYSDDLSDLLVESPEVLRARARSAAIGFERSGEEEAVSAYLYGTD